MQLQDQFDIQYYHLALIILTYSHGQTDANCTIQFAQFLPCISSVRFPNIFLLISVMLLSTNIFFGGLMRMKLVASHIFSFVAFKISHVQWPGCCTQPDLMMNRLINCCCSIRTRKILQRILGFKVNEGKLKAKFFLHKIIEKPFSWLDCCWC